MKIIEHTVWPQWKQTKKTNCSSSTDSSLTLHDLHKIDPNPPFLLWKSSIIWYIRVFQRNRTKRHAYRTLLLLSSEFGLCSIPAFSGWEDLTYVTEDSFIESPPHLNVNLSNKIHTDTFIAPFSIFLQFPLFFNELFFNLFCVCLVSFCSWWREFQLFSKAP